MTTKQAIKRWLRRNESGQSVVFLALAFIALIAFIGITTDVSIMFVRYSQLSRAVDSAAIAAANQMREDRTIATVSLAARQFIEFHGLDPEQVLVDTCDSLPESQRPVDELCTEEQSKLVRVTAQIESETVFLRLLGIGSFPLEASSVSQTAALDVVIVMDVSNSMAQDTTIADWAYIRQRNAPGIGDTVHRLGTVYVPPLLTQVHSGLRSADPGGPYDISLEQFWGQYVLSNHQEVVNQWLKYGFDDQTPTPNIDIPVSYDTNWFVDNNGVLDPAIRSQVNSVQNHPRRDCRLAFSPFSVNLPTSVWYGYPDSAGNFVNVRSMLSDSGYDADSGRPDSSWTTSVNTFDGYVPTYNFFGCCNDPISGSVSSSDGSLLVAGSPTADFSALTCQPFKQARDATFDFLERIDFFRGDRAGFVTFSRSAFLINPYGTIDVTDIDTGTTETIRPGAMIDSFNDAYEALRMLVGVRAEPNFYVFEVPPMVTDVGGNIVNPLTARWVPYSAGIDENGQSIPVNYKGDATYGENPEIDRGDAEDYEAISFPVSRDCIYLNAGNHPDYTLFDLGLQRSIQPHNYPLIDPVTNEENSLGALSAVGYPNPSWLENYDVIVQRESVQNRVNLYLSGESVRNVDGSFGEDDLEDYDIFTGYETLAGCSDTNIGAALREANNALVNPRTVRRFGTVWVIVMLSDGAAGASDPIRRNETDIVFSNGDLAAVKPQPADPYNRQEVPAGSGTFKYGVPGEYGAFGLCPYGTVSNPGEVVAYGNDAQSLDPSSNPIFAFPRFPYCSDEDPKTRNRCNFRPFFTLDGNERAMRDADYVVFQDPTEDGAPTGARRYNYNTQYITDPDDNTKVLIQYTYPADYWDVSRRNQTFIGPQDAGEIELEWNRSRNNLYDVLYEPDRDPLDPNFYSGQHRFDEGCLYYDVDDYARDWADFIGLQELDGQADNVQLPTIFTIGFGLGYTEFTGYINDSSASTLDPTNPDHFELLCQLNKEQCLGEQLLRYIADVGDNNTIDNDYFEWLELVRDEGGDEYALDYESIDWGSRGPCQTPFNNSVLTYDFDGDGLIDPDNQLIHDDEMSTLFGVSQPGVSCGNYYAAPSSEELQFVFDDIASRMFTRLSR